MTTTLTVRDFNNTGYLAFKRDGITVLDNEGKRVIRASVNLRNGQYSILRHWDGEHGSLEGDVIVVPWDYELTMETEKAGEAG